MVPIAQRPEVGRVVVVAGDDVVDLGGELVAAATRVRVPLGAATTVPLQDVVADARPVLGEAAAAV